MTESGGLELGGRLGGLARTSLREQALDVLRNAVTSGRSSRALTSWRPSSPRRCRSLAGRCGRPCGSCSRRDSWRPARGAGSAFVLSPTPRFWTCSRFGPPSRVSRPPSRVDARSQGRRQRLQAALDALDAATGSINDMVEIDLNFHRLLCELTGNNTLVRTWEALAGSIRMSIMFAGTDRALTNMSVPRHQTLIDAIATGDPDRARTAVEEHMRGAAHNLLATNTAMNPAAPERRLAAHPSAPEQRRRDQPGPSLVGGSRSPHRSTHVSCRLLEHAAC